MSVSVVTKIANGRALCCVVFGLLLMPLDAAPTSRPLLPEREWRMILQTAAEYGLTDEQTWLLAAIRRLENGRPGLEFGVGGPMNSGHPAHRYQDGIKSFKIQCAWAAGTIRRRYRGDLSAFGRRYCPPHAASWSAKIASIIVRLKNENADWVRLRFARIPRR